MRRALTLAGRGFTPPNPMVGCVLVRDGQVVGEGHHRAAGAPHAETEALAAAGSSAAGATAYVTLEPCCHFGRTPPCTQALIAAGVSRVVAAVVDADSRVAGQGLAELAAAGIQVESGLLEREARLQNEAYFHHRSTGMPYVSLKAAISLDGKIATRTGSSRWISSAASRRFAHRERARSGAVLCGIGTVLADDPLLTARFPGAPRQPLRVILDSQLRLPLESRLVATARAAPTLVATDRRSDSRRAAALEKRGVEILRFSADNQERIPIESLMEELGRRGILSILVEGGAQVHAAFLEAGRVQRLLWFVGPMVIGGEDAPGPIGGEGVAVVDDAARFQLVRIRRLGPDLLIEAKPDREARENP